VNICCSSTYCRCTTGTPFSGCVTNGCWKCSKCHFRTFYSSCSLFIAIVKCSRVYNNQFEKVQKCRPMLEQNVRFLKTTHWKHIKFLRFQCLFRRCASLKNLTNRIMQIVFRCNSDLWALILCDLNVSWGNANECFTVFVRL